MSGTKVKFALQITKLRVRVFGVEENRTYTPGMSWMFTLTYAGGKHDVINSPRKYGAPPTGATSKNSRDKK